MKKLTIKQKKFADEYIISGNASDAARNAGYSPKYINSNVQKLLQNTAIKQYVDERLAELSDKQIAKQEEVLKYLTSVMRGEQTEQTLISEGAELGQRIANIEVSAKDRIKAAELLGKRYGSWTDKVDLSSDLTLIFEDDYGD